MATPTVRVLTDPATRALAAAGVNMGPIGARYAVGGRTFVRHTPRAVLADALQEAGRVWEAELLRSADPVVLADRLRLPHAGDAAVALAPVLPVVYEDGNRLEGRPGAAFDAVAILNPDGESWTETGWWMRWPAAATPAVFAVALRLRRARRHGPLKVQAALAVLGIELEFSPVF